MNWPKKLSRDYLHLWLKNQATRKEASWVLGVISFTESSFFLIPPDFFLISILLADNKRWWHYTLITIVGSVLGGIFGYLIGLLFFDTVGVWVIETYNLTTEVQLVGQKFNDNAMWAIFVSAFTPIPYKVFTISAGFFKVNLFIFVLMSSLGRGLRFLIIGYIMRLYGPMAGKLMYKYFNGISLFLALVILTLVFYSYIF